MAQALQLSNFEGHVRAHLKVSVWNLLVLILTLGLLAWTQNILCPDVAGQLWLAHAMRGGMRLYTDVVEINPPLWFWLAVPVDWLAAVLRVRPEPIAVVGTGLAVLAATNTTARLLDGARSRANTLFLLYAVAILLILPARMLEQREHLAMIAALPYLSLAAARRRGDVVDRRLAWAVGVGSALGFALKPHFLAVPGFIELWLLLALRKTWNPLRAEAIALVGVLGAYLAAIVLLTPDYVRLTLPLFAGVYRGTGASFDELFNILPIVWIATGACVLTERYADGRSPSPLSMALLIGSLGFATAWAVQHKGWSYQGVPVSGCVALALAAQLLEGGTPRYLLVRVLTPALLLWPVLFITNDVETRVTPANDIAPALEQLRPGDAFGFVSTRGITTWPAAVGRELRLSTRYGQYWMLDALDHRPADPAVRDLVKRAIRETALDYRCLPPRLILFRRLSRSPENHSVAKDPYALFASDPDFADVLSHYRLWRVGPTYDAWTQASPLPGMDAARCRRSG